MRLSLCICASLFAVSLFGQGGAAPFDQLVRDVDAVVPAAAPQQIFDTPEAKRLSEAIRADVETNRAEATIRLLRQHQDTKPSWQVTVETVSGPGKAPTFEDVTPLESMFTATIKEGDHWLNYAPPRGWTSPYQFRYKLAKLILLARTGAPQDVEDQVLLRDNPSRWLSQLNPTPTQSTTQSATNRPTPNVSTLSVHPSALSKAPETKPAPTPGEEPTSSTPWSVVAVLVVAATGLLWLLVKKRK